MTTEQQRPPLDEERRRVLETYRQKLVEYREVEDRLKECEFFGIG